MPSMWVAGLILGALRAQKATDAMASGVRFQVHLTQAAQGLDSLSHAARENCMSDALYV